VLLTCWVEPSILGQSGPAVAVAAKMAAQQSLTRKMMEKFYYDFSLYKSYFSQHMDYSRYVALCVLPSFTAAVLRSKS
jgi:hypothetical protein